MTPLGAICLLQPTTRITKPSCSILEQISFQSSLDSPTDTSELGATTLPCRSLEGVFEKGLFGVLLPLFSSHQLDMQIEDNEIFQSK